MKPSFDTWTIIFLIAAAQGGLLVLLLCRRQTGFPTANRLLAVLLGLFSLSLIEYVLYWTNYIYEYPHFANISVNFPFIYGPLIWLYLKSIYECRKWQSSDWVHFLPYFLASLPFLPWYFTDLETKQQVIATKQSFNWHIWAIRLQFWARMIHVAGFAMWNFRYTARQPVVGQTERWARLIAIYYLVFVLAYISYFILVRLPFFNSYWDYHISAVMTAMIYLIAYAGFTQPGVFNGLKWSEATFTGKYRNSGLTTDAARSLSQQLTSLMEQEKIFLEPDISLEKLAAKLETGKHHVSQVINETLGVSFFEFINQWRIEEAKRLLQETSKADMNVIEVAYSAGFNNKGSFNAAFKKSTGMTPTEFRRRHHRSDHSENPPQAAARRN